MARDQHGLTKREVDILRLLVRGRVHKQIAFELGIATQTVKEYSHNLLEKTGVGSSCQLGVWACTRGYAGSLPSDSPDMRQVLDDLARAKSAIWAPSPETARRLRIRETGVRS